MKLLRLSLCIPFCLSLALAGPASAVMPEYTAAEAKNHIGQKATIVGKVDCIEHGRTHTDLEMGACLPNTLLMVVVPDDLAGLKFDVGQLRGATIAVTGKIESSGGMAQIMIKSATQIVPRTPVGPDYLSTAMEKQSRGDLDGAIADLDRAIEQAHEPGMYVQRAEAKMMKGDLDGAIHDYDQLLERYPNEGVYYLNRGRLKMKKSDYAGVVADSSRAIELLARHYASHPNDHSTFILAQAYSERGEAKEAMGDPPGAITDYENSVRNDPNAPIYKNKLKHAQAQASRNHEQSFNKSEVTPESIAEAFVQAYSGANVDALAGLYADRVDYTNSGVISNAAVRAQAKEYFARWPVRQWSLVGPAKTVSLGSSRQKVIFSASYDASDPQTNKHASGIATETLILATDASGAIKIVSQKEQISKGNTSQPGWKTSEDPRLKAAKAEASKKQPVANPSQTNAPAQAQAGKQTSPDCTSDSKNVWSEASPDKRLLATIRFVPDPEQKQWATDELKVTVFRRGRDGKSRQIVASTTIVNRFLQCAHWSPDSQFLLFTTSLSRGAHSGWHSTPFVYRAADRSFKIDVEEVSGTVIDPEFHFESPDIAVLTVLDEDARRDHPEAEEMPSKQVKVSLSKLRTRP
jgi:hypothetical protein